MKLGEYETFGDGRVHCKSGAELDRAVYEGFIRALHEAHERGEVIVRNVGLPLAVKCETTYVEPLTAAAIGEAVAKALDERNRARIMSDLDEVMVSNANKVTSRSHSVCDTAELDALREVAEAARERGRGTGKAM